MNIISSKSALKEAKRQAIASALRMQTFYERGKLRSWDDIERLFNISVDPLFKSKPFNFADFSAFREIWKNSVEQRLAAAVENKKEAVKIHVDKEVVQFGSAKLFPEQVGVFKAIRHAFWGPFSPGEHPIKAAMNDGYMGTGKTWLAAALIADRIFNAGVLNDPLIKFLPHPFMIFTPKGVVEHWKRVLESFGLEEFVAKRKIYVFSNGEFMTSIGDMFCTEKEDPATGETYLEWDPLLTPIFAVLDECHNYIREGSGRTKKIVKMLTKRNAPKTLFMSATPGEKVNDFRTFCIALDTEFLGMKVNSESFNQFAKLLDREPHKPNLEGVKRLRNVIAPYIFSFPYVKPKFKAVNRVWLVDFANENDRRIYATAIARYQEACRKSGKDTPFGQFKRFIELNILRRTVEPLRSDPLAARAASNFYSGKLATAIGTAYKETVAEVVFQLVDKYSIPRDQISIIWGGKRQYRSEDLFTKEEIDEIFRSGDVVQRIMRDVNLKKKLRNSIKYMEDRHEHDETYEEQSARHKRLGELGLLGKQNDNSRQIEIDKFQDGSSRICIFTLASGGVGLSFDRDKELLLPREGLFTPVYNGKEFQQVLGRLVRRASLSDANQYICMMNNTVEAFHVAPILDNKLRCTAAITNRNFDIIDLLSKEETPVDLVPKLRSDEEAIKDAENDDTIVTDFVKKDDTDEEEDEEIETVEELLK